MVIEAQRKRRRKQLTGMLDRVVEDMILSSMASGKFSNLKGSGKPLKDDTINLYIDSTQQRINRILRDNGFCPPWILKEKELKLTLVGFRKELKEKIIQVAKKSQVTVNEGFKLDDVDEQPFKTHLNGINKLIRDYNLIAPSMDRQLMDLRYPLEYSRALEEAIKYIDVHKNVICDEISQTNEKSNENLRFFTNLIKKYYYL